MTSSLPQSTAPDTAVPGPMFHPTEAPFQSAGTPKEFTPSERADDAIWKVDALLAARLMELAMKAGNRDKANMHRVAMEAAVNKRRALRIAVAERAGGCFFDAAGQVDQVRGAAIHG